MPRTTEQEINLYIEHFNKIVERLKKYKLDESDRIFKKNILVSVLDAISRATSDYNDGNRDRFVGIIDNFSCWEDRSRVSAPQLQYLLKHLNSRSYERARKFIAEIVEENSNGEFIDLSNDPKIDEIKKYWPVPIEQKLFNRLSLSSFTHKNLFYSYRNSLVHELQEPGYGMEFHNKHKAPFYHGRTSFEGESSMNGIRFLELVYPLNFYFSLTEGIINNVRAYLIENNINPYEAYSFGSSWIGDLN